MWVKLTGDWPFERFKDHFENLGFDFVCFCVPAKFPIYYTHDFSGLNNQYTRIFYDSVFGNDGFPRDIDLYYYNEQIRLPEFRRKNVEKIA